MPSTQWGLMGKLVQQIYSKGESEPFRDAVDWESLGLYDYPQIVKRPMDLGQIKRKIEKEEYASVNDAANDVRLVWQNCKTYNADGSDFYNLADTLSTKFEDKFAKLLKELGLEAGDGKSGAGGAGTSEAKEPSLEDKKLFAKRLYKISKEDLGKVIIELDSICPQAITKNSAEDQVEINVDNIDAESFSKVMQFVATCVGADGGTRRKKSSVNTKNKKARTS
mmetsp:Transcript_5334/g.7913  ORF Transcript_5334/g.7913 Transcript_5334/m.7913 type:complete len:223 (+) Transcript_5334:144-812(+)|eukprot:CAMPEP_0194073334 /NCGR_PEP_ID=MMETSP0149-20130528/802_1 /TAXON_ID=122233 /ORGANISM="Chaetoceros debilis, Strain MM31A-1" /LENGTH=222 /DNA_ID=CAMNT_0038753343 /DNA_START=101 /DNA_END=769 /DNA_ORIENTATION=-